MKCEIVDSVEKYNYERFVQSNNSSFYQSIQYLSFLQEILETKCQFILLHKNKEILGVLPFFEKQSKYGKVINSLPFFGSLGGVISENIEYQKNIINTLNSYNKENDVLSSVIIQNPFHQKNMVYRKYFIHKIEEKKQLQCISLKNKTEEVIWNLFEQRVRRAIRKCTNHNVTIKSIPIGKNNLEHFYQLHKNEMESKSVNPKPKIFFELISKYFTFNLDYNFYCAQLDNKSIAYLLVFYSEPYTEYFVPASDIDFKTIQGLSLLIWNSIKDSIKKNMLYYNFGGPGAHDQNLYRFKRGWNSVDYDYSYFIYYDNELIKEIDVATMKSKYEHFYVIPYGEIKNLV